MKHMLIMRTTQEALDASAEMDFEAILHAMGAPHQPITHAGVMAGGDGLAPEPGWVVNFDAEAPVVSDGPYGEVHELFNGFWIVQTATAEEALEWAKRAPLGAGSRLEVRRITDESDFADFADNEFIQKEAGWREDLGTA